MTALPRRHYDLPRAGKALKELLANPDDLPKVFTVIESLPGNALKRMRERILTTEEGRQLLSDEPNIVPILSNREALRAMPEDSLAHAYLKFVESENISAQGIVDASGVGETAHYDDEFTWQHDRMRDTHDLWHAVTGYHGDIMGEAALLAFSLAQTGNPGIGLIVAAGLAKAHDPTFTKLVAQGFRAGMRAAWLPAVDWEALLSLPLDEVRRRLQVEPAPAYEPRRTFDLRASGRLQPLS